VSTGTQSGSLDAAAFGCQSGAVGSNGVGFYFGLLEGSGSYSLGSGSVVTSYTGSLIEVAVSFEGMAPYIEGNNQAGFQYDVTQDEFSCSVQGVDCIPDYSSSFVDFNNLLWNPITVTNTSCAGQAGALSTQSCYLLTFTIATTDGSVQFDMHLGTQPVSVNGNPITPNSSKLDVSWSYPAANYPSQCNGACSALLIVVSGGKTDTASGGGTVTATGNGVVAGGHATYSTGSGPSSYFAWQPACTVGGVTTSMYTSLVTGQGVSWMAGNCTDVTYALDHLVACTVAAVWAVTYDVYKGFGWDLRLHFFSVAETKPGLIVWDPAVGSVDCNADPSNALCVAGATSTAPLLALLALLF